MGRGSLRDSLDKTIDVNNVINGKGIIQDCWVGSGLFMLYSGQLH